MKNTIIGIFVIMGILAILFWLLFCDGISTVADWLHMLGIR